MTFTKSSQQLIREFKEHQQGIAHHFYRELRNEVRSGRAHQGVLVGAARAFRALGYVVDDEEQDNGR